MNEKAYTLHERLKETTEQFPDKIALQLKQEKVYRKYTYREFHNIVQTIARSLIDMGIQKSDKVAIILENRPEWGAIYFGIVSIGAVAVPIDPQSSPEEIKYLVNDSNSKILFCSDKLVSLFNKLTEEVFCIEKIIVLDYEESLKKVIPFSKMITSTPQLQEHIPQVTPEDVASIVYTSGTTGGPKGVMLTHANFLSNFQSIYGLNIVSSKDNILSVLPLHHTFPFTVTLIIPLLGGATISYITSLKSDQLLECMRETGVTILVGVPQLFYMFYKHIADELNKINPFIKTPLSGLIDMLFFIREFGRVNLSKLALSKIHTSFGKKLRFFVSGGAPLNEEAAQFLTKIGFTIIEGYGLTETSPVVTLNPLRKQKIGSVGRAIPDVKVRIHNPDEKGIGEIVIMGPNVMKGYYKRDEETGSVLRNGWFYSGDLGYVDKEGYVYITGRLKEIIVLSSGKNISPVEVESHYACSPFIKEICILGVGRKEETNLGAVVLPDLDYMRKFKIINIYETIKQELENLSKQLPSYKRITNFVVINEELPLTRLGKIKRFEVKNKYIDKFEDIKMEISEGKPRPCVQERGKSYGIDEDTRILSSVIGKKVTDILSQELKLKRDVRIDDHLELNFGIDSLGRVELMADIEKTLDINIPESLMAGISTVKELILEVEKLVLEQGVKNEKLSLSKIQAVSWGEILRRTPPGNIIRKVDLPYVRAVKLWTIMIRAVLYSIFRIIWRIRIINVENLPDDKTFILCPNHVSYLDGFIIAGSIGIRFKKDMYFLGQRDYFEGPILKRLTKLIRVIPIDPAVNLVEAMQAYAYILTNGRTACVFPEGARSIDGEVKEFKKGIGILAKELNVPLIPVYISGSYESWPRTKTFPKPYPITVVFGDIYYPEELIKEGIHLGASDDYQAIALGIREKVIELKKM